MIRVSSYQLATAKFKFLRIYQPQMAAICKTSKPLVVTISITLHTLRPFQYFGTHGYQPARCAKRMPTSTRWAHESAARVNITPYILHTPTEQAPSMKGPGLIPMGEQVKYPLLHPRTLRLTEKDFVAHGYTPGCRKCALAEQFGMAACNR